MATSVVRDAVASGTVAENPAVNPVVVGVDRSDESAMALHHALLLARDLGRPVTVVHAVGLLEEGGYRSAPSVENILTAAQAGVEAADQVAVRVVREDGPAADVLVRCADREDAAYIVVGRRGMGAAPRPLGSVSEQVLERASQPVLVVSSPPGT